jgi:hypothetical protein
VNLLNVFQRLVKFMDKFYFIIIFKWNLEMLSTFRENSTSELEISTGKTLERQWQFIVRKILKSSFCWNGS